MMKSELTCSYRHRICINHRNRYEKYYEAFEDTFAVHGLAVSFHFLPGNNDVGYGFPAVHPILSFAHTAPSLNMQSKKSRIARRRYHKHFGPFNQAVSIANHTLVLIDAPGLVEEDNTRASHKIQLENYTPVKNGPMEFVKSIEPGE